MLQQGARCVPRSATPAVETGATNVAHEYALAEAFACVSDARPCSKSEQLKQVGLVRARRQGNDHILVVQFNLRTLILSAQGRPAVKLDVSGAKMQGWLVANNSMSIAIVCLSCSQTLNVTNELHLW